MKTMALATRSMKLFALLLAVVMLFSACGGNENTSSEIPSDAVSDTVSTDSTDAEVADDTASKKPDTIASSKKNEGTTTNNQTEKEPTIKTSKTTWDKELFRLDDACQYKTHVDAFSVNGTYYAVATHDIQSCEDTNFVT